MSEPDSKALCGAYQFPVAVVGQTRPETAHARIRMVNVAQTSAARIGDPKLEGNYRFGATNAAEALRWLAEEIDAGKVAVQDVAETTLAAQDDFTFAVLSVIYAQRVVEEAA